jgi:hypothetical protein
MPRTSQNACPGSERPEVVVGELAALVCIEDLRFAILGERFLERFDAKGSPTTIR